MSLHFPFSPRTGAGPTRGALGVHAMKLEEALLCVDCESLYSGSGHCPQCGSQVAYPLVRALNRPAGSEGRNIFSAPLGSARSTSRALSLVGHGAQLMQSA